ncbi:MAG: NAD+ synthase [Actinomycetota bacterium]|nr:NAD+ synthase [Actinomycetota bacterium]MDD5665865.1 NAD+ synthase [Actinomycetota bacterium]
MLTGPTIDAEETLARILDFIRERMEDAGKERLVVGLSGGLDSAVSSYLAVRALDSGSLTAFIMPYKTTDPQSTKDALLVASELSIAHKIIDITPMVDAYFDRLPEADRKRRGNYMARTRMAVLYDQSAARHALVLGTGNRTESLLGYTTLWGDMACAFTPLGGLYKTQVRELASHLGVPARVITKPPSADLWQGQTDEGEMGLTYEEADRLLYGMVDLGLGDAELQAEGFDPAFVGKVRGMVETSSFKRCMPPSCHP